MSADTYPLQGDATDRLLGLRAVIFRYKEAFSNGEKPIQYGLIAEEVAEVFPELVVYDEEGRPETVKYHLLSTMLLNEMQRERAVIDAYAERTAVFEFEMEEVKKQLAAIVERSPG